MPSVLGQNYFIMEKQKVLAECCTFICTICGDGFSQYQNVLSHMSIHGPLESFTFDGSSNGFEVPREYVLQENGTLTALTGLTHTEYTTKRPSSPGILPSHFSCPAYTMSPSQKSFPRDVLASKSLDSNLSHSHGGLYHCELCGRTFNSLQFLHRHQQYRILDGGYRCTLCCRFFKGRLEFKKHMQNHTYEGFHCCGYCGKRFLKTDSLKAHINHNHSSTKLFDELENSPDLKLERSYTCKKCKLSFFWLTDFQIHSFYLCKGREVSATFENEVASRVSLKTCNGTSTHAKNGAKKLINASCENDSTYTCGLCGERFPELTALKEHHRTHESKQKIENSTRKAKSGKRLLTKGNCRIRKKHLSFTIHPCKLCSCVFHHSNSLTQHMRHHKGTVHISKSDNQALGPDNNNDSTENQRAAHGNYKCHKCEKKFGLLCVFKTHLRYHRKEGKATAESTNSSSQDEKQCQDTAENSTHDTAPNEEHVLEEDHIVDKEQNGVCAASDDKENVPEPVYTCTKCSQTFACMETFVQHQLTHGSEN
ncbi:zinc finger protein 443 [Periophthalmus magnuspinnatus]|uniref:zinc finger protein 443 n=1 Tax=Periophthalmus magnuspinnatus TaxID=409849 RepID=UPI00145A2E94|nr:zinc finger protein 443 [Periophthalmus magnuspinnatus]